MLKVWVLLRTVVRDPGIDLVKVPVPVLGRHWTKLVTWDWELALT